jgi:hypothetical protein
VNLQHGKTEYVLKYNTVATNFEHAVIALHVGVTTMHVVPVVERIQYEPWWRDAFVAVW